MSKTNDIDNRVAFSQYTKEEHGRVLKNIVSSSTNTKIRKMSSISRIILFLCLPFCSGFAGLVCSFISSNDNGGDSVNFEKDFAMPFLLTLVIVFVIGIQSNAFSKAKASPLISWPKVKRKKKVIRKVVVIDDNGDEIDQEDDRIFNEEDKAALEDWKKKQT